MWSRSAAASARRACLADSPKFEPEVVGGRQLQVKLGGGSESADLGGGTAGLAQQLCAAAVEQVDRAKLLQRPQLPDGQLLRFRDGQRLFEGVSRGVQVAQPGDPADDLQRLAANLGARRGRLQGCLGELAGLPEVVAGEREFGGEHVDQRPAARPRAGLFQPLRGFQVRAGDRPAGSGDRCPGELDMDVRRARGGRGVRDQPLAERQRLVGVPGECQAAEQQALGACPGGGVGEQDGGAPERSGGGGQGAAIQGRLARRGEQRTGPRGVPRPCGQVGGDVPPRPVEGGVRRVHSGERGFRQPAASRRQLPVDDGLAGERVPEPEDLTVDGHQLDGDSALQGRGDGAIRHGGGGRQQLPVEAAAKQRGRLDDPPFFGAEPGQPGADGLGERRGHAW